MIKINCDLGERGLDHPVDKELMHHIQIANIACGGHAGDVKSVSNFRKLAEQQNVMVTAHLSYPDRQNFGRKRIDIGSTALLASLDDQMQLVQDIKAVKFHGALYNDSVIDRQLAVLLAQWAGERQIEVILAPADSAIAEACTARQIGIMPEAFAERRYTLDTLSGRLCLVNRNKPYASIPDTHEAVAQTRKIATEQKVKIVVGEKSGAPQMTDHAITAETICIHSDAPIALTLARAIKTISQ